MKYQVSLEGRLYGRHVQLAFIEVNTYKAAIREARSREHLPPNPAEEYIALLFTNKRQAIIDGVPRSQIERVRKGDEPLYRYRIN